MRSAANRGNCISLAMCQGTSYGNTASYDLGDNAGTIYGSVYPASLKGKAMKAGKADEIGISDAHSGENEIELVRRLTEALEKCGTTEARVKAIENLLDAERQHRSTF